MATIHTFTGNEVIATEVPKYLNDNFSALNSVDEDIETQLGAKAPLASPTLTGTPKAPTASEGTNTTQIATTAFVASAVKVKSVNGKTGDVVVGEIVDASINGRVITLTFADGTTKTLTTQDTVNTGAVTIKSDTTFSLSGVTTKTITVSNLTAYKPLYVILQVTVRNGSAWAELSPSSGVLLVNGVSRCSIQSEGDAFMTTYIPTKTSVSFLVEKGWEGLQTYRFIAYQ